MKKTFYFIPLLIITVIFSGCYSQQPCAAYSSVEKNIEDVVYLD